MTLWHTTQQSACVCCSLCLAVCHAVWFVQEQADHVRHMKEVDGLEKGDPVLDEAVAELLQRKDALQKLQ